MKLTLFTLMSVLLLVSCQEKCPENYTQTAPEIDTYKKSLAAYEAQNWEEMRANAADTAKIYHNALEDNGLSMKESIEGHKNLISQLSSYGFEKEGGEIERVITDNGEMWVNYWGTWFGVIAATGKRVTIPLHLTAQFVDGKIVKEYGFWDSMPLYLAMQEAEAAEEDAESTDVAREEENK